MELVCTFTIWDLEEFLLVELEDPKTGIKTLKYYEKNA